jgi:hypothetical protein
LWSEHGVGEKALKSLGEVVGEEDGGCRVLGSCSVRDSWALLSGMLLVLPESLILLSGMLLIPPESWMLLVDMLPIQRLVVDSEECTANLLMVLVRLRKCAVQ